MAHAEKQQCRIVIEPPLGTEGPQEQQLGGEPLSPGDREKIHD